MAEENEGKVWDTIAGLWRTQEELDEARRGRREDRRFMGSHDVAVRMNREGI